MIDISKLGVFGSYKGILPESNSKKVLDDLQENSTTYIGFEDGKFDENDYILFYAQAPTTWSYNIFTKKYYHHNNIYSDTSYYFFTPDKGTAKSINIVDGTSNIPTQIVTSFSDYAVHENDFENMISSGKEWYGERFTRDTSEREFVFSFPNLIESELVYLDMDIIGRAHVDSYYEVSINGVSIVDSAQIRMISSSLGIFARKSSSTEFFIC